MKGTTHGEARWVTTLLQHLQRLLIKVPGGKAKSLQVAKSCVVWMLPCTSEARCHSSPAPWALAAVFPTRQVCFCFRRASENGSILHFLTGFLPMLSELYLLGHLKKISPTLPNLAFPTPTTLFFPFLPPRHFLTSNTLFTSSIQFSIFPTRSYILQGQKGLFVFFIDVP